MDYEKMFSVEGAGAFPIDMLRYDSCAPATAQDSARIESSMRNQDTNRRVSLRYVGERGWRGPSRERWASFMWEVVEETVPRKVRK